MKDHDPIYSTSVASQAGEVAESCRPASFGLQSATSLAIPWEFIPGCTGMLGRSQEYLFVIPAGIEGTGMLGHGLRKILGHHQMNLIW